MQKSKVQFKIKKSLLMLLFFLLFLLCPSRVFAQQKVRPMFRVSPVILPITLSPGRTYEYNVRVDNLLTTPLPLSAAIDSFLSAEDEEDAPPVSPLATWTTITPQDMIIPPGETRNIQVTVKIPQRVPVGGYYASMYLTPVLPGATQNNSVSAKVAVLMLANIGVPKPITDATIRQFDLSSFFYHGGDMELLFKVKNLALYHFSAKPIIKIQPLLGESTQHILPEKIILPGHTRRWEEHVTPNNLTPGIYQATLAISVGEGHQITTSRVFLALPSGPVLTWIALIILITVSFLIRKRLSRAWTALIGKKQQ